MRTRRPRPWLLAVLLGAAGCEPVGRDGMVMFTDKGWRATMVARDGDGFSVPDGLVWRDGGLYMADEGGAAIRFWQGPGAVRTLAGAGSGIVSPEDLAVDGAGNVYFTDDNAGGVWKAGSDGKVSQIAGKAAGIGSTEGIALAPSGEIMVGDAAARRVLRIAPDGTVRVLLGPERGIAKPESLAFDGSGNLYIADNEANVLYLLTRDGRLHRTIAGVEDFSPESIWHSGGGLYVTDSANGKLFRYTPEEGLRTLAVFGGSLEQVGGVTTDPAGRIYVSVQTDLGRGRGYILRLERKGS